MEKLVTRNLLRRNDDPDDRRHLRLELTEEGARATGELSQATHERVRALLSRPEPDQLQDLNHLLAILEEGEAP